MLEMFPTIPFSASHSHSVLSVRIFQPIATYSHIVLVPFTTKVLIHHFQIFICDSSFKALIEVFILTFP